MSCDISIPMVDLVGQYNRIKDDVDQAMAAVLSHGRYVNGPEVGAFAEALGHYVGVNHVIPCGNGTDALQMALMSLELHPGDEVITSSFSFIAALEVIVLLGLKPVLVDVDPRTYTIDVEKVRSAITSHTRVVIPVHLFGQGADMRELMQMARAFDLYVVEDAAQCMGANYRMEDTSPMLGSIGHIGCTSFFPSKNLGCFGDGGACMTNDEKLAERLRSISHHGTRKKYCSERIGINSRLDSLQAAVLQAKLPHLDAFNKCRARAANDYSEALRGVPHITLPGIHKPSGHVYNQYTIRVEGGRRDALREYLAQRGIPTMVYYPLPLHQQPGYAGYLDQPLACPVSEMLAREVLSLPMHSELKTSVVRDVARTIKAFFDE